MYFKSLWQEVITFCSALTHSKWLPHVLPNLPMTLIQWHLRIFLGGGGHSLAVIMQNSFYHFFPHVLNKNCVLFTVPPVFNRIYVFLRSFFALLYIIIIIYIVIHCQRTSQDTPGSHRLQPVPGAHEVLTRWSSLAPSAATTDQFPNVLIM